VLGTKRKLKPKPGPKPNPNRVVKKQTTRLIKVSCKDCGYVMRITRKWLAVAVPECPSGCDKPRRKRKKWKRKPYCDPHYEIARKEDP
jgi:hypothetical protein